MSDLRTRPARTPALEGYLIVDVGQPLGAPCVRSVLQEVSKLIDAGKNRLVINLAQTTYLSCVGIGTLVHLAHIAQEAGGRLLLAQLAQRDSDTLALVGLTDVLQVVSLGEDDVV